MASSKKSEIVQEKVVRRDGPLLGHDQQRSQLALNASKGTLAHSNLFVGPRGIGKHRVALSIAQLLLCEAASNAKACENCESCRLFKSGNHPDLHKVECEKEGLNAELARELLYSITLAPYRGKCRAIIFNDADSLSTVVANLLLKSLEEPRKETFFFLVAANSARLPIPVISRCQIWRFSLLAPQIVTGILKQQALNASDDIVQLTGGSLEHLSSLQSSVPHWQNLKTKLGAILAGDSSVALELAAEFTKDKEGIAQNLGLLRLVLMEQLRSEQVPQRKLVLADGIENLLVAERMICERNLAPLTVLNLCFLGLSGELPPQGRLISEIVV